MQIIQATTVHLDALAKLFDGYRIFYQQESNLASSYAFLKARMENKESIVFLALHATQEAMGFVQLYPIFSSTRMKRVWLLNDLYVNPLYRQQGVGKGLMEAAKTLAQQTDALGLVLETAKDNQEANALYPKIGFSLDTTHNYYFWENS